jgi:hypothetical protein
MTEWAEGWGGGERADDDDEEEEGVCWKCFECLEGVGFA